MADQRQRLGIVSANRLTRLTAPAVARFRFVLIPADHTVMKRIALLLVALSSTVSMGCATCCAPFDYAYPTYGGKYERADRFHGRVGSAFNDASGMMTSGEEYYDEGTMIDSEGEVIDDQQ